jgi:hypothetical protein
METEQHTAEKPMGDQSNREEIKKFLKSNEHENTNYQNLWDTTKAMLRGKFITLSTYIKKTETSQVNNLMMHLKLLEKQDQTKIGKEEVKLSIFADDMILHVRDPQNTTKKLLEIIKYFSKVTGYKINIKKSVAFLHTNNAPTEKEIRETIPFTIASKTIKYLRKKLTNKTKGLFN